MQGRAAKDVLYDLINAAGELAVQGAKTIVFLTLPPCPALTSPQLLELSALNQMMVDILPHAGE